MGPDRKNFIEFLRRAVPFRSYPRQPLLTYLSSCGVEARVAPCLSVIDVFEGGKAHGVMCRFSVLGDQNTRTFVAPLDQLSFDRRRPLARSVVAGAHRR